MRGPRSSQALKTRALDAARSVFKLPRLERALVALTQGQRFGTVLSKLPPNYYQYAETSIRSVRRYGVNFELDVSDLIQWYLYYGFLDPSHEALLGLCPRGAIALDVGANIGITALRMSGVFGSEGRVYAFEPDPSNFEQLAKNVALNPGCRVEVLPYALSDMEGSRRLSVVSGNRGMNHFAISGDPKSGDEVKVSTVDAMVDRLGLTKVDVIKVDVEGAELGVLRGAQSTLRAHRPRLFVELNDEHLRHHGASGRELVQFLLDFGYSVSTVPTHIQVKDAASTPALGHVDLVCLPANASTPPRKQ